MKLSPKKQLCITVGATILLILAAFCTIKYFCVWRVTPIKENTQNQPETVNVPELLSFNNTHPTWDVPSDTNDPDVDAPLFDLFTSPNVYKNDQQLIMEPCTQWQFDTVFPLRLKAIKNKKYRLQFEGYIQPDMQSKEVIIIIHDLENDQILRCEQGQSFSNLDFSILSFNVKTVEKEDIVINTPVVQIFDSRTKQKIELTGDTKYYPDKYEVTLENIDGSAYILPDVDQEVKIGESTCVLNSVDTANNTVVITLIDANKQEIRKRLRMIQ